MTRGDARWRAFWVMMAAVLAIAGGGILWGAKANPETSGLSQPVEGIQIVTPESGSRVRGVVRVKADWDDPSGYLIYRVDGEFVYASSSPYEMRWDSSTITDGEHVITADAYDSDGVYHGTSSVKVVVENTIPTPPEGVLLQVRFTDEDHFVRRFQARSEIGALTSQQALPQGFEVLSGHMKCELTQSVMDAFYEGNSALVRNRLRQGEIAVGGARRTLPEVGRYAMVQISRNGLAVPAAAAVSRPRLGLGEISLALPDVPVFPGDQWESPLGAVFDIYTRQAVFVQATHTFEGLRWFRGHECALITSTYSAARVPLYDAGEQQTASSNGIPGGGFRLELTQMMGGGRRGGGRRGTGRSQRGTRTGSRAQRAAPGTGTGGATRARPGTITLESVRLANAKGTRRTYLTTVTGRVLHTEDVVMGKLEFRAVTQLASSSGGYSVSLTQMMGGGRRGGGMRGGGMRGGGMRGGGAGRGSRRTAGGAQTRRATSPSARTSAPSAKEVPANLDYALKLTGDLLIR